MTLTLLLLLYTAATAYLVFWASLWIVHLLAIIYGKWRLYRRPAPCPAPAPEAAPDPELGLVSAPAPAPRPGVSIIKPLVGTDTHLVHNLETFFKLDYHQYEILFCIQDLEDGDNSLYIQELMKKYPDIDVRIFRGGENVVKEDTLTDMVEAMREDVGLVHQMPYTCDGVGLPSTLEKVYFGTFHARIYLSAAMVGVNCATGMSALMRKELLDKAGGFQAFGRYLAEDFFFAKYITDQNYKLAISSQPAAQNAGNPSVSNFHNRISRWIKLRSAMVPHTILLEPISECMLAGALASLSAYVLFRVDPVCFYMVHVLAWFMCDWVLIHIVQNGNLPFNKFEFLVMWLFRECGAPYLFLHAILNPDVSWRSQRFRLKWGGEVEPVLVPRTKADIVKEPSSVKFSSPEEITPLPQHVKRHSRHNSLQLRHEILKMEKDVISD